MTGMRILTIGHSTHDLEAFVKLLKRHDVAKLGDVRSTPYSRYNPQFNREPLANGLAAFGLEYVYLGAELGGRSDDPSCFENGRIRYDRLSATHGFQQGLKRLIGEATGSRIALMCAEKEPLECHRTLLVAPALEAKGVAVEHILADGGLEAHGAVMGRLVAIHGDGQQGELFATVADRIELAIAKQAERIAYRSKRVTGTASLYEAGRKS